jgi:hypothetical protein
MFSVHSGSTAKAAPASTKIPAGLTEFTETSNGRFSDTTAHGLCVPKGQLVSSGHAESFAALNERLLADCRRRLGDVCVATRRRPAHG